MRVKHHIMLMCLGCLVVSGVGCQRVGHLDERERNNRIVLKAYELSNQGDYDAAIGLFTKALETYPRLSRPHLDIALLLHDRKRDYVRAIYHYHRYIELRPGTEKMRMITGRIQQAERAFVASFEVEEESSGRSVNDLEIENRGLKDRQIVLVKRIEALEAELATIREAERLRYKATVVGEEGVTAPQSRLPAPPVTVLDSPPPAVSAAQVEVNSTDEGATSAAAKTPPPVTPPVATVLPVATAPEKPAARSYTVRPGDSLSKIAFKVYGDATKWRKLQNANRTSLGDSVNVKVGQVLIVP